MKETINAAEMNEAKRAMDGILARSDKSALRMMTKEDCALIVRWRNKPSVREWYIYREPFTLEGEEAYYEREVKTGHVIHLMVLDLTDGYKPVGCSVFNRMEPDKNQMEGGIFLGEDSVKGKGIGSDAYRLATRWVFAHWPMPEAQGDPSMISHVATKNIASIRMAENVGFRYEKTLKDVRCTDGTLMDMVQIVLRKSFLADE